MSTLLDIIEFPRDLRNLKLEDLPQVCQELRDFIIDESSKNPGHFGASLGTVELTVALHYVLNTPYDRIVWDVGHQAYSHKILTGRKKVFHTNRKYKGISGFPNPAESEYDSFIAGHSSTSISAALGMAIAAEKQGQTDKQIVAVIGDGSMTGGMAFEALNHAGFTGANMLVVLNDNNMAIDANVGALNQYLTDITMSAAYNKFKDKIWSLLGRFGKYGSTSRVLAHKFTVGLKSMLLKESNLFEALRFRYFGPIDGHNVYQLVRALQDLQKIKGPKILHVKTQKGKGFKPAETAQTSWHAPRKFDKHTGEMDSVPDSDTIPPKYQDVFGETLLELAKQNDKIVGVTPAMASGCSLNILMKEMPDRAFDVGIAEQHAVTLSAGMAKDGLLPFCNIYSSFMQRAYDQVIHDVALQNLGVIFCLDRAGIVGADGATHHGVFDIAYMRTIPNLIIASPLNEVELRNLMFTASQLKKPFVIRYPRGNGEMLDWRKPFESIEIGKGCQVVEGKEIAILSFGPIGNVAIQAAQELEKIHEVAISVYNMRFVKPLDKELLKSILLKYKSIVTIEDGAIIGGFGSAISQYATELGCASKIYHLGVPDTFIKHGSPAELFAECKLDKNAVVELITSIK